MQTEAPAARKRILRKEMTMQRGFAAKEADRLAWSKRIGEHVAELLERQGITSLMAYASFRSEVSTAALFEWAWSHNMELLVPRSDPATHTMSIYRIFNWSELKLGAYGIPEPDPLIAEAVPEAYRPGVVIVPGLAFDSKGGRLGYGGGYYDRYYAQLSKQCELMSSEMPPWIGLAFELQLLQEIPVEAHDVKVNAVVTENRVYYCD